MVHINSSDVFYTARDKLLNKTKGEIEGIRCADAVLEKQRTYNAVEG